MTENNGIRASMALSGFTIRYGEKRLTLAATLEGDLPVDTGQWDRTKGIPFASVEVLDLDDEVIWEFQRPMVSAGETTAVKLLWAWPRRLPPDPKDATRVLDNLRSTMDTLLVLLYGAMNDETIKVRIFEEPKAAPQGELSFNTKAKELVVEAIERLRPKPGSGVESVTLSTDETSVTLHSDGSTTR